MFLNLYSGRKQKQHIDETLEELLESHGYAQSYTAEFVRLGLGFAGVALAAYAVYIEHKMPFASRRALVAQLCAIYFVLQGAVYLWKRFVEKNALYIGTKDGETVYLQTRNPRNSPKYELVFSRGKRVLSTTYTFDQLVDSQGVVHREKLTKFVDFIR